MGQAIKKNKVEYIDRVHGNSKGWITRSCIDENGYSQWHYKYAELREVDFLPGIVIDKFSDVLVVESLALGIDRLKPLIIEKLKQVLAEYDMPVRGVYERSDAKVRLLEGMERFKGFIRW